MSNLVISLIRTWVPIVVGAIIAWLLAQGIIDPEGAAEIEAGLAAALIAIIQGAYYLLVRLLSAKWPTFGYLLGVKNPPEYADSSS